MFFQIPETVQLAFGPRHCQTGIPFGGKVSSFQRYSLIQPSDSNNTGWGEKPATMFTLQLGLRFGFQSGPRAGNMESFLSPSLPLKKTGVFFVRPASEVKMQMLWRFNPPLLVRRPSFRHQLPARKVWSPASCHGGRKAPCL